MGLRYVARITIVFAAVLLGAGAASAADDILIADFEGRDYGDWEVEGAAFGTGPAKGTRPGQMPVTQFRGKGLVNTYDSHGDGGTGTLTSPEFVVSKKQIKFLIGDNLLAVRAFDLWFIFPEFNRTAA